MGSRLDRKILNYEERVLDLEQKYFSLKKVSASGTDKTQHHVNVDLKLVFELLSELDQSICQFLAIKYFLEYDKAQLTKEQNEIIELIQSMHKRYERELPLCELITETPALSIIRRQLHESSKEAGKIAYQLKRRRLITSNTRIKS